ncbi:hypothetical protein BDL97_01G039600 [Sphagnum fallax]|nr:hypothetical protein BDL97_01G039600 [Sphagnum fallax]
MEASSSVIYDSHLSHQSICKTLDSIIPRNCINFLGPEDDAFMMDAYFSHQSICKALLKNSKQQHQEENQHINTNLEMMNSSMDMERIGPGFDLPLFVSHGTRSF